MSSIAKSTFSRQWLGGVAALLLFPLTAHSAPLITLGTYNLLPNTPNQQFNVYVGGGDTGITGVDFALTTGDGGPASKGTIVAPTITNVNLLASGTLFSTNNNGSQNVQQSGTVSSTFPPVFTPQFYLVDVGVGNDPMTGLPVPATLSGSVTDPVSGRTNQALLAVVTIDTTGFFLGSYSVSVDGTVNNGASVVTQPTDFPPESTNPFNKYSGFTDGVITIVPEPASLGLLGLVFPALLLRRRRSLTNSSDVVNRLVGVRI